MTTDFGGPGVAILNFNPGGPEQFASCHGCGGAHEVDVLLGGWVARWKLAVINTTGMQRSAGVTKPEAHLSGLWGSTNQVLQRTCLHIPASSNVDASELVLCSVHILAYWS
jgi:hypothetical protein